ncbi:hypothetical protein ACFQ51_56615 [Streptomyces kaempferi]
MALRRASARVRKYCRQQFTLVENETVTLPGNGRILRLPQRPVVVDDTHPLTVVELFGISNEEYTALEGRDFTRIGSELTRGEQWWAPTRLMGWPFMRPMGIWAQRVRVTYSHGYSEVPDDVVDVVLDLAQMSMTNPQGLRSESIDDYSRTFAAETIGGAQLTAEHKEALRQYRGRSFSVAPVT